MHPFYFFILEAFGCGLGQLVPNRILQINGVIARCHELGQFSTIDLLFTLYRVKSIGVQFYFDKKEGCTKLGDAPGSNTEWHEKWAWYEMRELDCIGSWLPLCPARVRSLSRLGSKTPRSY